ncbi:wat1-related protein [Quercus suber]|uniref:Wat1-related protein n=1 Tax=Quercus suber TaxID=58331 RepID=A0AAW0LYW9_QUESU
MGEFDYYKPALAMIGLQFIYAGYEPRVLVVYRQVIATLIMAPIAWFRGRVTANQNAYFEGLYLASSTAASAMANLIPAITFVMAAILGGGVVMGFFGTGSGGFLVTEVVVMGG